MLEVSPEKSQLQERRSKRSKNIWNTGSYLFCFFNNTWFVYSAIFVNKTKTMANMITPNSRSFYIQNVTKTTSYNGWWLKKIGKYKVVSSVGYYKYFQLLGIILVTIAHLKTVIVFA